MTLDGFSLLAYYRNHSIPSPTAEGFVLCVEGLNAADELLQAMPQ